MLELLLAEAMFAFTLKRRNGFVWKIILGILVCFSIAIAFPTDLQGVFYDSILFVTLFLATVILGIFCFDTPIKNIVFCGITGFTIQHIASEGYELCDSIIHVYTGKSFDFYSQSLFGNGTSSYFFFIIYLGIFVLVYGISLWLLAPRIVKYNVFEMNTTVLLWLVCFIVLIDVIVGTIIINVLPLDTFDSLSDTVVLTVEVLLHGYNILCCLLAIVLLVELPRKSSMEAELQTIIQLRNKEKTQYQAVKENMDVINIKCHDLKNQMRTLVNANKGLAADEVEKIGNAVNIYQSAYRTKNDALNVVLMEKDMICKNKNISLSCILDAEKLNFMKEYDIYALFGNIMDNAIEAVSKLESDKRSIGLQIKVQGSFLMITEYNGYSGNIDFNDGLPVTTKANEKYHGYGLKSIRYIVNRYKGNMKISTDRNVFELIILFQFNTEK